MRRRASECAGVPVMNHVHVKTDELDAVQSPVVNIGSGRFKYSTRDVSMEVHAMPTGLVAADC